MSCMSVDCVSLLFDFVTKNLHLATIFYHLVAKWRLDDFVNFRLFKDMHNPFISKG